MCTSRSSTRPHGNAWSVPLPTAGSMSSSGQIRCWKPGAAVEVDAPRSKVAIRFYGDTKVQLGSLPRIVGRVNRYAVVALTAAGGSAPANDRMLLTLASYLDQPASTPRLGGGRSRGATCAADRGRCRHDPPESGTRPHRLRARRTGAPRTVVPTRHAPTTPDRHVGPAYDTGWYPIEGGEPPSLGVSAGGLVRGHAGHPLEPTFRGHRRRVPRGVRQLSPGP